MPGRCLTRTASAPRVAGTPVTLGPARCMAPYPNRATQVAHRPGAARRSMVSSEVQCPHRPTARRPALSPPILGVTGRGGHPARLRSPAWPRSTGSATTSARRELVTPADVVRRRPAYAGCRCCAARRSPTPPAQLRRRPAAEQGRDTNPSAAAADAHAVLVRMDEAGRPPTTGCRTPRPRPAAKAAVGAVWPAVDPAKLVLRLLADAEFLAAHADGLLSEEEQKRLAVGEAGPERASPRQWSAADAVLIDEAGRPDRAHALARARRARRGAGPVPHAVPGGGPALPTGSATVLGDLAQGTTPVGDPETGGGAGPPGQAGRGGRGADGRFPRADATSSRTPPGCCPRIAPG
ncbi:hypothetical protein SALBM217S_01400 [Streptomyces griseoloalbus]